MEYGLLGIVILVLDIMAILSILESGYSAAGKLLWALLVLALPLVGMILWFMLGSKRAVA